MGRFVHANGLYKRIYAVVRHIPSGHVATYGQIARIVGRCTARAVGYAMAALPCDTDVPWHRVINRHGKISPRSSGEGSARQRQRLEGERIHFDQQGRVDLNVVGWAGPSVEPRASCVTPR
jgi:methylated-DNA-protein-cysteine methyltransferase-like protein